MIYDDAGRKTFEYKYQLDSLLIKLDSNSLSKERKESIIDTTNQHEAIYKGGDNNFSELCIKTFKIPERTLNLHKEGKVIVRFVVDIDGQPTQIKVFNL